MKNNSILRLVLIALSIVAQGAWIVWLVLRLTRYSIYLSTGMSVLALILSLHIYGRMMNSAYKIPWIILVMVFPVFGVILYFLTENPLSASIMTRRLAESQTAMQGALIQDKDTAEALEACDLGIYNQFFYLFDRCGFPVFDNADIAYYGNTTDALEAQKLAMRGARNFIFIEYFAVEDSVAWSGLESILAEKAAQGVDVRVFYDDLGSISFLSRPFGEKLESLGIQCQVFNPLLPVLDAALNYRSHRKITVVDGEIGFLGGYNLADEYFNITHPYGQWKDAGVRIEGSAVRSLTVTFLETWNATKKGGEDPFPFLPEITYVPREHGFIQPYADSPCGPDRIGKNVYLNMIKNAKRSVFITTPYLILDDETQEELILAARRGVDVRIVTPGIPDKKLVYSVTHSYYPVLSAGGVRIYEYSPGFLHAKQFLCDGEIAAVGSSNLDFRSLYLNFENGCLFYGCQAVQDVGRDFEELFSVCEDVTERYGTQRNLSVRGLQCILRLFSPLM